MKLAIVGQQDFGKAVLEAFLARGDDVAGVFCAPDKEGAKPDPLKVAAAERNVRVFQFASLKSDDARAALRALEVDIGVMAYVLQFAPQDFVTIPRQGTIQYHPSLLPLHRGPSSINWPIIRGETRTGLTIFRPTDGLDEGPLILQKEAAIGPDDTLGSVYFERLFPQGVAAMLEAADLVAAGRHQQTVQDESRASYEGWCRAAEAKIYWHDHVDHVYDLIRGCNPAPGAWTTLAGKKLQIFDARKHPTRTFGAVKGKPGEISEIGAESIRITAHGGQIEVLKLKPEDGKKMSATEFAQSAGLSVGMVFGS
jgi:methionyl-tRNA formyltransferase